MEPHSTLDVAVALIAGEPQFDLDHIDDPIWSSDNAYYVATRPHGYFKGQIEFPGGKIEAGETDFHGLSREIYEEVNLNIEVAKPLFWVVSPSPEPRKDPRPRRLSVWQVTQYSGKAYGAEGQSTQWRRLRWTEQDQFLGPNRHMFTALRLKPVLAIINIDPSIDYTPSHKAIAHWAQQLASCCEHEVMIRLRCNPKSSHGADVESFGPQYYAQVTPILVLLKTLNIPCIIDALPLKTHLLPLLDLGVGALHFQSWWQKIHTSQLQLLLSDLNTSYPQILKGFSCHCVADAQWADQHQFDFMLISPIKPSSSHPEQPGIGWDQWQAISSSVLQPTYGLGGLEILDYSEIKSRGGYGIAGISLFNGQHFNGNEENGKEVNGQKISKARNFPTNDLQEQMNTIQADWQQAQQDISVTNAASARQQDLVSSRGLSE